MSLTPAAPPSQLMAARILKTKVEVIQVKQHAKLKPLRRSRCEQLEVLQRWKAPCPAHSLTSRYNCISEQTVAYAVINTMHRMLSEQGLSPTEHLTKENGAQTFCPLQNGHSARRDYLICASSHGATFPTTGDGQTKTFCCVGTRVLSKREV